MRELLGRQDYELWLTERASGDLLWPASNELLGGLTRSRSGTPPGPLQLRRTTPSVT